MTRDEARELLNLYNIYVNQPKLNLLDTCFLEQISYIESKARLKAAFCTRRSGKSYSSGVYLIKEAYENKGVNCLYVGLSRKSAKNIMWPILKKIISDKKIWAKPNLSDLSFELINGSKISLTGTDSSESQMEKLLGVPNKLIVVDESASYKIDVKKLVYSVLQPTTVDNRGTISLIGTPGDLPSGLFFDITTGKEPGWEVHKWSALQNTFVRDNFKAEMNEKIKLNPDIVNTPWFRRNYMGEWVIDEDNLVYKWRETKNGIDQIPLRQKTTHVLGVDLGYQDDTAFVVSCYNEIEKTVYEVVAQKFKGLDFTDVAKKIEQFQKSYDISIIVADGANRQGLEEIRKRHNINLKATDKIDKNIFIELMNTDLLTGKIKTLTDQCEPLIEERQTLIRRLNHDKTKWSEDPRTPNHLCDAALYAWRYCYSYLNVEPQKKMDKHSDEYAEELLRLDLEEFDNPKTENWWET